METCCDFCAYNEYDEDDEEYYCSVNMDEDDMARFVQSSYKRFLLFLGELLYLCLIAGQRLV